MSNRNDSPADPLKPVPFTTTIRVRDNCLCLHSQRAARAIARKFDEAFRPLDLKSGQFSILMSLNRPEPPTLGAVADLLGMDRTTLTANLKPLERRGLLAILPDAKDRRLRRLSLTDAGRDILFDAVPLWEWTQAELEKALGIDGEPDRLRSDLNTLA
ncbi:MarR family winged helix-turn-helix transcriptional regulator [Jiella pelagia]|uniref:MarR family winged helix-turn-helix transcriptional regulator n=1 Tax=Jiella pelagia TaxID=2986949 RepID=A0ABY7C376_9HYPH|nr:MarR family winged helix-turn-helix transcriptional regulator [Jiella pelagia]WAP70529.1 MarR family winged helix-turn-helix transcriptional regulator [Jiella pelagia]